MEHIYNFSVIRVSPDPRRGEIVNVGIAVFLRGRIDVRIIPSLAKVQALHGELDVSRLHALPETLNKISKSFRSLADRYRAIKQIGMVDLSEIGKFHAENEHHYHRVIEDLLTRLVKPTPARPSPAPAASKLRTLVKNLIKESKLLGRNQDDIAHHKIVENFALSSGKGLYADFAGRNSVFYVTETIDYRVDRGLDGPKFNESAKAAMVLRETQSQYKDSKRIVIYAASARAEQKLQTHLNLISEFSTEVINFESQTDRYRYIMQLASAFGGELPLIKN